PDNHELPKGLFETSMNQSSYSNSSCLSLNHTLTQLCTYGNPSADKIGIVGGVLGGVTTVAILVGAGLFIARMIYRTKVERR
ncbi:MAG: hypothetical protein ACR2PX_15640, partial [Endozoicomonas sp.]|uniref:hypothetical protein n=1 Tax=Endozoicomonas sp. TaxID=1892382 RepID=UPI003D9B28DC